MSSELAKTHKDAVAQAGEGGDDCLEEKAFRELQEQTEAFILFELDNETFAIALQNVCEIVEYVQPCVIPTTNEISAGVINLRGQVVPVLNISRRLGLEEKAPGRSSCILLIELPYAGQITLLGLKIDKVVRIVELTADSLAPAPEFGVKIPSEFVQNMLNLEEQFVPAINIEVACNFHTLADLIIERSG